MSETEEKTLLAVQSKIQNLKPDPNYYHYFQELLRKGAHLIGLSDSDAIRFLLYRDELKFYEDENNDDKLERFYKCKTEALTIIAKKISACLYRV